MTTLDAAEEALRTAGRPLTARDLTIRMLKHGPWDTTSQDPELTVATAIRNDIRKNAETTRFRTVGRGLFGLREPEDAPPSRPAPTRPPVAAPQPSPPPQPSAAEGPARPPASPSPTRPTAQSPATLDPTRQPFRPASAEPPPRPLTQPPTDRPSTQTSAPPPKPGAGPVKPRLTVLQAAEKVLREAREPLHVNELTKRMMDQGLWKTDSQSPEKNVRTSIGIDISKNPDESRFRYEGGGAFALKGTPPARQTAAVSEEVSREVDLTTLNAAEKVLRAAGRPLHYTEITKRMLDQKLWESSSKKPETVVFSTLSSDIKKNSDDSKFRSLRDGSFEINHPRPQPSVEAIAGQAPRRLKLTVLQAAEEILRAAGKPLSYGELTRRMQDDGRWQTKSVTPQIIVGSSLATNIKKDPEKSRFRFVKRGVVELKGLLPYSPQPVSSEGAADETAEDEQPKRRPVTVPSGHLGAREAIEYENDRIREQFIQILMAVEADHFEQLISDLFNAMGIEDVKFDQRIGDQEIDVRGTLVVANSIRVKIVAHVRRGGTNTTARRIEELRQTVGPHEHGLMVTTGAFTDRGKEAAVRSDAAPIGLIDRDKLVALMIEHGIGIESQEHKLLRLVSSSHTPSGSD